MAEQPAKDADGEDIAKPANKSGARKKRIVQFLDGGRWMADRSRVYLKLANFPSTNRQYDPFQARI
jgi:hypothetical protein